MEVLIEIVEGCGICTMCGFPMLLVESEYEGIFTVPSKCPSCATIFEPIVI